MIRYSFEPIELITHAEMTIALIGFCHAHAEAWGDWVLTYFPAHRTAFDPSGKVLSFTPDEIDQIELVYRDML